MYEDTIKIVKKHILSINEMYDNFECFCKNDTIETKSYCIWACEELMLRLYDADLTPSCMKKCLYKEPIEILDEFIDDMEHYYNVSYFSKYQYETRTRPVNNIFFIAITEAKKMYDEFEFISKNSGRY